MHIQNCSGRNRLIPLIRRPNPDSTPNKPVTLPRNQLLIRYRVTCPVHSHDTALRYAVTLQVWTHLYCLAPVKQHDILKVRNALVNAFQCKGRPPYLQSCAYGPYVPQQVYTPPLKQNHQHPRTAAHPVLTAAGSDHECSFCCISASLELRHCAVIQSKDKITLWTNAQLSEFRVASTQTARSQLACRRQSLIVVVPLLQFSALI